MRKSTVMHRRAIALVATALLLATLTACGAQGPIPTPTIDVTAIYTSAFQTLAAQQATQAALTPPTATASQTAAPTVPVPATGATGGVPGAGGPTAASSSTGTTGGTQVCNNATYVSDVTVPDGTVMIPGQNFVKTWTVKNTGTCQWTTDYKLVFLSGEAMGGTSVPLTGTVAAGQTANLSVALVAPNLPGAYTGSWRLQDASGAYFGDAITVVITVSGSTTSGSPAATSTP